MHRTSDDALSTARAGAGADFRQSLAVFSLSLVLLLTGQGTKQQSTTTSRAGSPFSGSFSRFSPVSGSQLHPECIPQARAKRVDKIGTV